MQKYPPFGFPRPSAEPHQKRKEPTKRPTNNEQKHTEPSSHGGSISGLLWLDRLMMVDD
jgi:hypothetical protein